MKISTKQKASILSEAKRVMALTFILAVILSILQRIDVLASSDFLTETKSLFLSIWILALLVILFIVGDVVAEHLKSCIEEDEQFDDFMKRKELEAEKINLKNKEVTKTDIENMSDTEIRDYLVKHWEPMQKILLSDPSYLENQLPKVLREVAVSVWEEANIKY
jgi:hypothetical protein